MPKIKERQFLLQLPIVGESPDNNEGLHMKSDLEMVKNNLLTSQIYSMILKEEFAPNYIFYAYDMLNKYHFCNIITNQW